MAFSIPGGKSKGTELDKADESSLRYWFDRISKDLSENPEKNYADRDRQWLAAAKTELVKRLGLDGSEFVIPAGGARPQSNGAGRTAATSTNSTLARSAPASQMVVGSSYDSGAVNKMLEDAVASSHLVSPATVCGSLPPGCEVSISLVKVDPSTEKSGPGDVAPVGGGKLSLSGHVLKRIGAAAGVSWDMNATGRLDDGSDPHYAHYRAVGQVRSFDGSIRTLSGEVEIDMREGSPQIVAMKARAKEGANLESQIRDTRLFLIRHAETKAKLRAIADMGVKRSYTAAELAKPFKVARLMWTGRSEDPELRRLFAEKTADAMIGATSMLYGGQPAPQVRPAPQMMTAPVPMLHAPPASGSGVVDDPYGHDEPDYIDVPQAKPTPKPAAAPATTADQTQEEFRT